MNFIGGLQEVVVAVFEGFVREENRGWGGWEEGAAF